MQGIAQMDEADTHPPTEHTFQGIAISPGFAISPAYLFSRSQPQSERKALCIEEIPAEQVRLDEALERSKYELKKVAAVAEEKIGSDSASIFEAQIQILEDPVFTQAVRRFILEEVCNAEYAVQVNMERHIVQMETSGNAYLRDRAHEFREVKDRVLRALQQKRLMSKIQQHRIVVAQNLTAADLVLFSKRQVLGCVMDFGGATSHASIMARALGVPAIISLGWEAVRVLKEGDWAIVDGFSGILVVNPTPETIQRYREKQAKYSKLLDQQLELKNLPAETLDGHRVHLRANIEFSSELPQLATYHAEGVGLLRTEMMYLAQGRALSEEEQFIFYKEVLAATTPYVATFRLIDLGGDKVLPLGKHEPNPFLGWRGVRILLDRQPLLRTQIRAILRASVFGPTRLMIPMVTNIGEVRAIKRLIAKIKIELTEEGHPFDAQMQVGIMVEVPSVALLADQFADEVDFFSIGTNDLTQYVLAVDRGNDLVANRFDEMHPAVLQLISNTIRAAHQKGIFVGMCGEFAANPLATPLLLGMGLDAFSVSPVFIPQIKRIIRNINFQEAKEIADRVLIQKDARSVRKVVSEWFGKNQDILTSLMKMDTT
ncbi:MAG: phosphoenolpyruvate--protein phosphotransferase [Rhodothermia bacterium]|nr:phosphoenolpyruvate--protein phosphotransferase [Rhodothermia bacterium]